MAPRRRNPPAHHRVSSFEPLHFGHFTEPLPLHLLQDAMELSSREKTALSVVSRQFAASAKMPRKCPKDAQTRLGEKPRPSAGFAAPCLSKCDCRPARTGAGMVVGLECSFRVLDLAPLHGNSVLEAGVGFGGLRGHSGERSVIGLCSGFRKSLSMASDACRNRLLGG